MAAAVIPGSGASEVLFARGFIRAYWWNEVLNLGDAITPLVIAKLSGRRIAPCRAWEHRKLVSCGSVISDARNNDVVWGTGSLFPGTRIRARGLRVTAVRGPLTRKILVDHGEECPPIYGDPGCLAALLHPQPRIEENRRRLGVIPHYADKPDIMIDDPAVLMLDIQSPPGDFFLGLARCDRVVSSSLHGIIFAESYGIPAAWMRVSDRVVGGRHKFEDYYLGTGRECPTPLSVGQLYREHAWEPPKVDNAAALRAAFDVAMAELAGHVRCPSE